MALLEQSQEPSTQHLDKPASIPDIAVKCTKCGVNPSRNKKDRRCNPCRNRAARAAYKPERDRNRALKYRYGITLVEYQQWYDELGGKCEICQKKTKTLYVDHNHKTLEIRGLLCGGCNGFLGKVDENVGIIERIRAYHGGHKG